MPFSRLELTSPLSLQECLASVSNVTDPWGLGIGVMPVIGKIGERGFHWRLHDMKLGWVLHASLTATQFGTRIDAIIRPGIPLIIWLISMGGFLLALLVAAFTEDGRLAPLTSDTLAKIVFPLLLIAIAGLHVVSTSRRHKSALIDLLGKTLQID